MAIARFLDRMCLVLQASGLLLRCAMLQNLIPSFPWIAPPRPPPWCNPRKGRDQILPSGNLVLALSVFRLLTERTAVTNWLRRRQFRPYFMHHRRRRRWRMSMIPLSTSHSAFLRMNILLSSLLLLILRGAAHLGGFGGDRVESDSPIHVCSNFWGEPTSAPILMKLST